MSADFNKELFKIKSSMEADRLRKACKFVQINKIKAVCFTIILAFKIHELRDV